MEAQSAVEFLQRIVAEPADFGFIAGVMTLLLDLLDEEAREGPGEGPGEPREGPAECWGPGLIILLKKAFQRGQVRHEPSGSVPHGAQGRAREGCHPTAAKFPMASFAVMDMNEIPFLGDDVFLCASTRVVEVGPIAGEKLRDRCGLRMWRAILTSDP